MKTLPSVSSPSRTAGLAVLLALSSSFLFAQDPAQSATAAGEKAADKTAAKIEDYRADDTPMNKVEVKAALDAIDTEIEHLDDIADAAPTPEEKADAKLRYSLLKDRRNELKKEFNRARYEAFKADLRAERAKVSAWTKDKFSSKSDAGPAPVTSVTAEVTADKIADYRDDATDINKAEVKASLKRLDADINLLDAKIDAINDPMRKAELKQRFKGLKERRSELNSEFRKARYEALKADVKAEWDRIVH